MTISSPVNVDFNTWRERYFDMTFEEHQAFNAAIADMFPRQRCFSEDMCERFLEERQPGSVVELGGWDGELAALMLDRFPAIETWVNYDITPNVPQVCDDPRYERVVLDGWPWERHARGDVLVASHVFEHMYLDEIEQLLDKWDVTSVFVDVPVGPTPHDWRNYNGTHILEAGWVDLVATVEQLGFETRLVAGNTVLWFDK